MINMMGERFTIVLYDGSIMDAGSPTVSHKSFYQYFGSVVFIKEMYLTFNLHGSPWPGRPDDIAFVLAM